MKFMLNNEEATLSICRSIKQSGELQKVSTISYRVESASEIQIEERCRGTSDSDHEFRH